MMMIFWDIDIQMLEAWILVAPSVRVYTVYTELFHKYGGSNVAVTNFMSHFSMFVPTKATIKLADRNTEHSQGIGIILCYFTNSPNIYLVGPVYYFTCQPSNTISSGALKCYAGLKKVTSKHLEHCDLLTLNIVLGYHPTRHKKMDTIFKSKKTIHGVFTFLELK